MDRILAVDIGGTKTAVAAVSRDGVIAARARFAMRTGAGDPLPPGDAIDRIADLAHDVLAEAGWSIETVDRVGIAAPGPVNVRRGEILRPPNLPDWDGVPIVALVGERFGRPVAMDNDANGGALAEWMFGAGRGTRHLVYLTMSTGIGAGLVLDGRIYRGACDCAGEIGHHVLDLNGPPCGCGQSGCFEAFCSGLNVARWMREILTDRPDEPMMRRAGGDPALLGLPLLRDAARDGDPLAVEMWDTYALRLAHGIGNVINIFNPEVVALGTIAVHSGAFLLDRVAACLPDFAWERPRSVCRVVASELGDRIGELGAAAIALYDPSPPAREDTVDHGSNDQGPEPRKQ